MVKSTYDSTREGTKSMREGEKRDGDGKRNEDGLYRGKSLSRSLYFVIYLYLASRRLLN